MGNIAQTDELVIGTRLREGELEILEVLPASKNGFNYRAKNAQGEVLALKEFFLRDMCFRQGSQVATKSADDRKLFTGLVKTFMRDAAFLMSLDSPQVSKVTALFEENETVYMLGEIAQGRVLAEKLSAAKKLSVKEVEKIAEDLSRALVEIHGFGMLHRNITPQNIIIGPKGKATLLSDFGTFREDRSKASRIVSSVLQVSQLYTPFEIAFNDSRQGDGSDIYCVAAILYHAITGAPPASGLDRIAAVAEGQEDPYRPLEGRFKKFDKHFLIAIDLALSLFLEGRVQSATEFLGMVAPGADLTDRRRMKVDVTSRSSGLLRKGLFSRVLHLISRSR